MANERYILVRPPQLPELQAIGQGVYLVGYDQQTDRTVKVNVQSIGGGEQAPNLIWRADTEYSEDNIVEFGLRLWKSLVNNNVGNIPLEGDNWTEVSRASAATTSIPNWAAGVYTHSPTLVLRNNAIYRLTRPVPYESVDFEAEVSASIPVWTKVNDNKIVQTITSAGFTDNYWLHRIGDTLISLSGGGSINILHHTDPAITVWFEHPSYIVRTGSGNTISDFEILPLWKKWNNLRHVIDPEISGNVPDVELSLYDSVLFFAKASGFLWVDEAGTVLQEVMPGQASIVTRIGSGSTMADLLITPLSDIIGGGGHTFEDQSGTALPARNVAKAGAGIEFEDDAVNEKTVIRVEEDLTDHVDGADEEKHGANQIVNAAALPNLSLPANSKQSEINEAISKVFEETLIFRDIEVFEFTKSQPFKITQVVAESGVTASIKIHGTNTNYVVNGTVAAFNRLDITVDVLGAITIKGILV